jgi:hypothetical protein
MKTLEDGHFKTGFSGFKATARQSGVHWLGLQAGCLETSPVGPQDCAKMVDLRTRAAVTFKAGLPDGMSQSAGPRYSSRCR